jgi:hypothetical protein
MLIGCFTIRVGDLVPSRCQEKLQFDTRVKIFQKDTRTRESIEPAPTLERQKDTWGFLFANSNLSSTDVQKLIKRRTGESSDFYIVKSKIRPLYGQTLPDFPVNLSRSAIDPSTVHGTLLHAFQVPGLTVKMRPALGKTTVSVRNTSCNTSYSLQPERIVVQPRVLIRILDEILHVRRVPHNRVSQSSGFRAVMGSIMEAVMETVLI